MWKNLLIMLKFQTIILMYFNLGSFQSPQKLFLCIFHYKKWIHFSTSIWRMFDKSSSQFFQKEALIKHHYRCSHKYYFSKSLAFQQKWWIHVVGVDTCCRSEHVCLDKNDCWISDDSCSKPRSSELQQSWNF